MESRVALRNGYDAFISHNHTDKAWTRELAERLASVDVHGRPLRPWLDEKFLDPGELGEEAELTSALDRSRALVLVLSPASVASKWVTFELEYFLRHRPPEEVIPLLKTPCEIPRILRDAGLLDFTDSAHLDSAFPQLVERLCPPGAFGVTDSRAEVDHAWSATRAADPGGFDANPTPQRDALLASLLRFPIDDPGSEGLALTGFTRAAELLLHDHAQGHPAAYNMKMLLGESLAVAVSRHARYRQVAQRYLELPATDAEDPLLAFLVVRAYSKLAEIDPTLTDLGALLRVAAALDSHATLNNKTATLAVSLGRIAAKLRGTDLGDLLIHTLSEGGAAARLAAIGGISMSEEQAPPVFYLSELASLYAGRGEQKRGAREPPSRKLQALLFGIDLNQPDIVRRQIEIARDELRRGFGVDDIPYGCSWFALRRDPPAALARRAPFMGTVAKATTANMEDLALKLDASHVVCLTEPRIVDALFDQAGSLLIPVQGESSPQCRRLAGRCVPFAMLDAERMARLKNGDHVTIEADKMRVVSS